MTKSHRERRKELDRRHQAQKWEREDSPIGDECSSHPFLILTESHKSDPIPDIHLTARVSKEDSDWRPQLKYMTHLCNQMGITILSKRGGVESGKSLEKPERPILYSTMEGAAGSKVLLCDLSRGARNPIFFSHIEGYTDFRPTLQQIDRMVELEREFSFKWVIVNPNREASPIQGREFLKEVHRIAEHLPGRPIEGLSPTRARRKKLRDFTLKLRGEGLSYGEIGERLGISPQLAWSWVNEK